MTSSRYHNVYENNAVCFWTSAIVGRVPILRSPKAAAVLLEVIEECRIRYDVKVLAYVIMPDHIHIAVYSQDAMEVRRFIRRLLSMSSAKLAALTQQAADKGNETAKAWLGEFRRRGGSEQSIRIWKERGRAFPVTDVAGLAEKLNYIHENPVRAGLVARPEEWSYSSASWYANGSDLIAMDAVCL